MSQCAVMEKDTKGRFSEVRATTTLRRKQLFERQEEINRTSIRISEIKLLVREGNRCVALWKKARVGGGVLGGWEGERATWVLPIGTGTVR